MERIRGWCTMEQRRRQSYEDRFMQAYKRLEKPLFKLIIVCFALVIIVQLILTVPEGREMLSSVDRLEGERSNSVLTTAATNREPTEITIRTVGVNGGALPKAWVKVNGVPISAFTRDEVTVRVNKDDVLTIDTSKIPGLYRFEIDHNDPKISYPVPGTQVETNDGKGIDVGPVHFMN